jgi:NAD(P)-dependent dehydrogenase (short-subunit alcohol dehydrogenase family)
VNNAGGYDRSPTVEQPLDQFDKLFATNLRGPFFLSAAIMKKMVARGSGAVVNVSSLAGADGYPGAAVYGATKGAIDSLTRTWAVEMAASGVRVNAVAPGHTRTDNVVDMIGEQQYREIGETTPLGRLGEAHEIAEAIAFLASPRASYITGVTLVVDGGVTARGH